MSSVLESARKKVSFDVQELGYLIWDGKEKFERVQHFQKTVESDPLLRNDPNEFSLGREELYDLMSRKLKRLLELFTLPEVKEFAHQYFPQALPGSLNYEMFIPTILNLGTDEQIKMFYEPARRWEITGCYAQTELTHGSDMNRIETTATFDKERQEFELHTPNLGATKWWGSDLGLSSTHAVVQAQLMVDGKRYGVQNFVVPIRDVKTHEPFPGIEVGDLGPKYGYNSKDNGYYIMFNVRFLRMNRVRIPRNHLLSRYCQVSADGKVTKTGDDKVWHATMQLQRQHFLDTSWKVLGQALTIIVRYSLQRTQFKDKAGQEIPIFNYQLQQARIVPLIAEMYANMFGSKRILDMCRENVRLIKEKNDYSKMPEIHVALSAAKAYYTWNTFFGLERIRQCAGGHGYSQFSGLPQCLTEFAPCCTAEGDNTVLSLSVGKTILFFLQESMKNDGKAPNSTLDYLENFFDYASNVKQVINNKEDLYNNRKLLEVLRYNVALTLGTAAQKLQNLMGGQKLSFKETTDKHMGIILNEITKAHSNYWTFRTFIESVDQIKDQRIHYVLSQVQVLYAITKILENQLQIFEYGILKSQHFEFAKQIRDELLPLIKDQAIGLTEAMGYTDSCLRSAIGRRDGQVYETLFDWAANKNPINCPKFQDELFQRMKVEKQRVQAKL